MHIFFTIIDFAVQTAHASDISSAFSPYCGLIHSACGSGSSFVADFFLRVGNMFAVIVAGTAVGAIVWGSIKMITSGGNEQGREEGKKIVQIAVGGLILALGTEAIIQLVATTVQDIPGA